MEVLKALMVLDMLQKSIWVLKLTFIAEVLREESQQFTK